MSELNTGTLRAYLQPIVFIQLTEDLPGTPLRAGDICAAQYWGAGQVALTLLPGDLRMVGTAIVTAHNIKAKLTETV